MLVAAPPEKCRRGEKRECNHLTVRRLSGTGLAMSEPLPTRDASQVASGTPPHSKVILLVEDDMGVRSILKAMLEAQGYTVVTAKTGDEAFRLCLQGGGSIDLMFIDIVLPGISGLDLIGMVLNQ